MNILNSREIKGQAGDALKQNPKIILTIFLWSLLMGLGVGLLGLIPIAGPFLGLIAVNVMLGKLMMKIENKALDDEEAEISSYGVFVGIALKEFLITIGASIVIGLIAIFPLMSAMNNWDIVGVFRIYFALYIVILIGSLLLYVWYVFPSVYIAAKYNDYNKEERKEIMKVFKENGLLKRSILLELSILGEVIIVYVIGFVLVFVGFMTIPVLAILAYIGMIIVGIGVGIKAFIARVILYRELANPTEEYEY